MKPLKEMGDDFIKKVIATCHELNDLFELHVEESEMGWIYDKVNCFRKGKALSDYSVGPHARNYMTMDEPHACLSAIEESVSYFGGSERLRKAIAHAKKLEFSNLFYSQVKKTLDIYFKDEIRPIIDYLENGFFKLYKGQWPEEFDSCYESFVDDEVFDAYFYDEATREIVVQFRYPCQVKETA